MPPGTPSSHDQPSAGGSEWDPSQAPNTPREPPQHPLSSPALAPPTVIEPSGSPSSSSGGQQTPASDDRGGDGVDHAHFADLERQATSAAHPQGTSTADPYSLSTGESRRADRSKDHEHARDRSGSMWQAPFMRRRHGGKQSDTSTSDEKRSDGDISDKGKEHRPQTWKRRLEELGIWSLVPQVAWIAIPFQSWARFKPVLRSAIVAWLVAFFMVISPIERNLGNASFLVLVIALLQPAELPLMGLIEREAFLLLFCLAAWAWACIAIKIADAARSTRLLPSEVNLQLVYEGAYVEAAPSIVCCLFLGTGSAFFLYLKMRYGASPFIFSAIIACLTVDIILTTAHLFPYPNYLIGQSILKPMALKSAVTIVVGATFFPKSVNSLFVDRVVLVLKPLQQALRSQEEQFKSSPLDPEFDFLKTRNIVGQSERAVPLVTGASRLLSRELSFGLAGGKDLATVERLVKALVAPANGWSQYFAVIENDLRSGHFYQPERGRASAPPTRPTSRAPTPLPSRPPSPDGEREQSHTYSPAESVHGGHGSHGVHGGRLGALLAHLPHRRSFHGDHSNPPSPAPSRHHHHHHHHHATPVGTWESLRFAQLEERLHTKSADSTTDHVFTVLGSSSAGIMAANAAAIDFVVNWLGTLNAHRYDLFMARFTGRKARTVMQERGSWIKSTAEAIAELESALQQFKTRDRLEVVALFKAAVDQHRGEKPLPHRYLFQAFVHQHTSIVFAERMIALLQKINDLERTRMVGRLWFPSLPSIFKLDTWFNSDDLSGKNEGFEEDGENHREEEWYEEQGLGGASPRDPDSMEPTTLLQQWGTTAHIWVERLFSGNLLFAVKVATLSGLLSLPFYFRSTAGFCQREKALWTLFMAQLTFSRHRGEVLYALVSRLLCTVFGGIVAMLVWYIASGSGRANPFAFMAVWAVATIPIFIFRLHQPYSPPIAMISSITIAVVVGYSYKDAYNPAPYTAQGVGWSVAWKRLVEVAIGTTAAAIWSLVPPTSTLRQYLRTSHAATIHRIGTLHCQLLAYTLNHGHSNGPSRSPTDHDVDPAQLTADIISLRGKLRVLDAKKHSVTYETSLRGRWPKERYEKLFEVQLALTKLLSAAVVVSQQLGSGYSRGLLKRTKFAQVRFMADVLSVYSLCSTALRTAQPLPQLSPILFARYLSDAGFLFADRRGEDEGDDDPDDHPHSGLPRHLTVELMESPEYMSFAVGVITLSGIVLFLDRLQLATKELVGESFELPPELYYGRQAAMAVKQGETGRRRELHEVKEQA